MAVFASNEHGVSEACRAFDVSRATFYRHQSPKEKEPMNSPRHHRALSEDEENVVLDLLNSTRFEDDAVPQVYAKLLDDGLYYASQRTMYRILEKNAAVRERRDQCTHPKHD